MQSAALATVGAAAIAALLSNLMNNWPAGLLLAAAIGASGGNVDPLVLGALIGCTIGASSTAVGSLSTVFWLTIGRQSGLAFPPISYARRAVLPTLAVVAAACLAGTVALSL